MATALAIYSSMAKAVLALGAQMDECPCAEYNYTLKGHEVMAISNPQ